MDPPSCVARPYQVEILEKALKENTIVCLGTGTGKTFISATVIKELQGGIKLKEKHEDGGKRTFFLVDTVPLVKQQADEIERVSCLKVSSYIGEMGVHAWDKEKWISEFDTNEVLVMTAQILLDILTPAYIGFCNINLLVLDECHKASKNHPYANIMEFNDNCTEKDRPRILGLTASIINERYKGSETEIKSFLQHKMKILESNMRSVCITCADPLATAPYATKPKEIIKTYSSKSVNGYEDIARMTDVLRDNLQEAEQNFKLLYMQNKGKRRFDENLDFVFSWTMQVKHSDVFKIASDAAKYCGEILKELGPLSAYEAAKILLKQIEKYKLIRVDEHSQKVFQEVCSLLQRVVSTYEQYMETSPFQHVDVIPLEPFMSNKVHTFLFQILHKQQMKFKTKFGADLHAIVFVERRCTAVILSKLINYQAKADPDTFGDLKSECVLGHGLDASVHLADSLMKSSRQNEILTSFKYQHFNVLVATSVVEEGLDVRKCNLVVRFDGIGNYRQYAQSKGRARSKHSKFIIMTAEEDETKVKHDLKNMQEIERTLYKMCRNIRYQPTEEEIENAMNDDRNYIPDYYVGGPDSARITRNTCVTLLYRFCDKLQSGIYSSGIHFEYETRAIVGDTTTRATVTLPVNFPLDAKTYSSEWLPRKDLAKKCVSMLVCQLLHKKGVLDEHLLAVSSDTEEEEEEPDEISKKEEGTKKKTNIYPRKIPAALSPTDFKIENCNLFAISIVLSEPRDNPSAKALLPFWCNERKGFGILLPSDVPAVLPEFKLHTQAGGLRVQLKRIQHIDVVPEDVVEYHKYIIQMCSKKYVYGEIDFDLSNPRVSKGILVPLKPNIFNAILNDKTLELERVGESLIDFDTLKSCKRNQEDSVLQENSVIHKTYLDDAQNQRLYYVTGRSLQKPDDAMDDTETYTQYYLRKYERTINPLSYLLETIPISSRVSFTENISHNEHNDKKRGEMLVEELCRKMFDVDAFIHQQIILIPYILYTYECIINALELRRDIAIKIGISHDQLDSSTSDMEKVCKPTVMNTVDDALRLSNQINIQTESPSVMDVLESISTRQAKFPFDLERLEMLGDSFLKQAVTVYLYFSYPLAQEGKLTIKRTRCISNKNLWRIAKKIGMQNLICNSQFGNVNINNKNSNSVTVWLPPGYLRVVEKDNVEAMDENMDDAMKSIKEVAYQEVKDKPLSDCIEALIGVYFKTGGTNLALKFMQKFLNLNVFFSEIPEKERSATQSDMPSFYADFPRANPIVSYVDVEKLYEEQRLFLLEECLGYSFRDQSYLLQAMEHISYNVYNTNCYQRLEFLGDAVLDFLVTLHVFMNKKDLNPGKLTSIRSALVNNNTFALLVLKYGFHKHIRHRCHVFHAKLNEFILATGYNKDSFDVCFENPFVIISKDSEEGYHAPKILGDIFEAIAGAVFLDCDMNLVKVWEVFYHLMKDVIDKYMVTIPLNPVREFIEEHSDAKWSYEEKDGETFCTAYFGECTAVGLGRNQKMAKAMASWKALRQK